MIRERYSLGLVNDQGEVFPGDQGEIGGLGYGMEVEVALWCLLLSSRPYALCGQTPVVPVTVFRC
jgi:hypothetical protein